MAEWLRSGLQIRVPQFDSGWCLHFRAEPVSEKGCDMNKPLTDAEQIRALTATWKSATAAGEFEKIRPLMADDVVFLLPGQAPMRGSWVLFRDANMLTSDN
jgi:hypothetical protein